MTDIDKAVFDIISSKPYHIREAWQRDEKEKKPFDVSACIDRLNAIAKGTRDNKNIDAPSPEPTQTKSLF